VSNKNCPHCKKEFVASNPRQKFCCRNCSIYFWNTANNYVPKQDSHKKAIYNKQYRQLNKEKIIDINTSWYQLNKEKVLEYGKNYRKNNSCKVQEINSKWKKSNKEQTAQYANNKYNNDILFKLRSILRARLNNALKANQKTGSAVKDLGCSTAELKIYLESKFLPGMTWDNWSRDGWHIDHIKPLSSFDLTDPEQLKIACHYTNLQPLWAKDNLSKGDKSDFIFQYMEELI
jgi:hypothetical protein